MTRYTPATPWEEEFQRDFGRYIVLKITDAEAALDPQSLNLLGAILERVARHRVNAGKIPLQCVVVESDWPEYEPTWEAIKSRVMNAPPPSTYSGKP